VLRLSSSFLRSYRYQGPPPARLERVLAVGRAFLTVTALGAIYVDPTEPSRLAALTYSILSAYAIYSLIVVALVHRAPRVTPRHAQMLHGADILWTSALTFISEGPVSPFFLFFLFALLAAAYRWGFRETAGTAVVTILVYLAEMLVAAIAPWDSMWSEAIRLQLNQTILRFAYILLTGVLLGYLAEQEKQSRAELAAMADAGRQPRVNLGLGGSIAALAKGLRTTFEAASVSVVMRDFENGRTLLWTVGADDAAYAHRVALDTKQQAAWLFPDPGSAWHGTASDGGSAIIRIVEPGVWRLKRVHDELPQPFVDARAFRNVTAVNMGLTDEWDGRIYLFDIPTSRGLDRSLHFLEGLAEHVTPALTNVFLLRRLRARAGAVERARVARELHDGAIQALFGIDMKIEALRRAPDRPADVVESELADVQALLQQEVMSLRELMQALRPIELDGAEQLPDVIAGIVDRFRRDTGISAHFVATSGPLSLPPPRALEIIRIVQEALANVRRHSDARNVLVSLTRDDHTFRLVVEDDGRGFEFEGRLSASELDQRRIGPVVIRERARLAGAELAVDSTPGAGARVELAFGETSHG
jgi:signal transduction histidine kinase